MTRRIRRRAPLLGLALAVALVGAACGSGDDNSGSSSGGATKLSGKVVADGSSTVAPISEAVAEEFKKDQSGVNVSVGTSGTGGGFTKFCAGETDISDASREIKDEEAQACQSKGIQYTEVKVGLDGLAVVTSTQNKFLDTLSFDQLAKIFQKGGAKTWNQVDPKFPNAPIAIFAPDTDSGTYDFFNEKVLGDPKKGGKEPRSDYTASADDNTLVQGIAGEENSWGYFGYAYFAQNKDKLKDIKISEKAGQPGVSPTDETVLSGDYPLSRPLFLYVKNDSLKRPEVYGFVKFYLEQAPALVPQVGYVKLPDTDYTTGLDSIKQFAPAGS
jgi:phosphate transport system substrate-binding protein